MTILVSVSGELDVAGNNNYYIFYYLFCIPLSVNKCLHMS